MATVSPVTVRTVFWMPPTVAVQAPPLTVESARPRSVPFPAVETLTSLQSAIYSTLTVRRISPGEYGSDNVSIMQGASVRPAPVRLTTSPVMRPGCGTIVTVSWRDAERRSRTSVVAAAARHWATVASSGDVKKYGTGSGEKGPPYRSGDAVSVS